MSISELTGVTTASVSPHEAANSDGPIPFPSFPSDHYIVNVQWVSGGGEVLSVVWSVRAQNLSVVTHCSKPDSGDRHRWGCSEARNLLSARSAGAKAIWARNLRCWRKLAGGFHK